MLGLIFLGPNLLSQTDQNVQIIEDDHPLAVEIKKIIHYDTPINKNQTPGMLIGIIDGTDQWIWSYGSKAYLGEVSLETNDVFEIGSVTKSIVTTCVSALVESGKLSWDQSINDLLPRECLNPKLNEITISDLVSHQSGLPKYPAYLGQFETDGQNPFEQYSQNDLCSFISQFSAPLAPKTNYSHVNFALLELGLENELETTLERLLEENVFGPLKMTQTQFSIDDLTVGHDMGLKPSTPSSYLTFGGSEGLKSNLPDLLRFTHWMLGENNSALSNDVRSAMMMPQGESSFGEDVYVSRGWHLVEPKKKRTVFLQTGKGNGHHASIALMPKTKTGVVILSNSAFGSYDLAYLVLRMLNRTWKRTS